MNFEENSFIKHNTQSFTMKKIEYVHELQEGQEYFLLDKGFFTFSSLFYAGEERDGPDGILVVEQSAPFLWKDIPHIFAEEDDDEECEEGYDGYAEYVVSEMEM